MSADIEVSILIKGRLHDVRRWGAVPRIGEKVYVRKGSNPDLNSDGWCFVTMVLWHDGVHPIRIECEPFSAGQGANEIK